jgi:hypothetical protein
VEAATKIFENDGAEARLAELGMSQAIMERVLQKAFVGRANCTAHDPKQTPGTDAWRYAIRALSDELAILGWKRIDPKGLPVMVNDELGLCITVSSGDHATGLAHLKPKHKNPKGAMTEAAVRVNAAQYRLFPEEELVEEVSPDLPPYPFWTLLLRIDDFEVAAELSLSARIIGGKVNFWLERIILPSFKPNELLDIKQEGDDDGGIEIDVPIERKSA